MIKKPTEILNLRYKRKKLDFYEKSNRFLKRYLSMANSFSKVLILKNALFTSKSFRKIIFAEDNIKSLIHILGKILFHVKQSCKKTLFYKKKANVSRETFWRRTVLLCFLPQKTLFQAKNGVFDKICLK